MHDEVWMPWLCALPRTEIWAMGGAEDVGALVLLRSVSCFAGSKVLLSMGEGRGEDTFREVACYAWNGTYM
ncbi:uncharacterized protein BT62DRAFT_936835 [Guyanagaster necrorhizus]|uniref:Uncharacterized protein n=1 Tax=Guyanagaster necrorhizus TaxID=856835 RepID=A0A9P7VIJ5_9AGAR|nr:uncharacterized protein BT62DRAFT_936835 [Guyanagaster necrorhizus MCA 3950]KAG7441703.1 hypothetical protein BT62DRAFT_936835 [Guyanagaster necrorhizus MCA 3950]